MLKCIALLTLMLVSDLDTPKNPILRPILSSPPINEYEGPVMLKYLTFMCAIAYQLLERGYYALLGGAVPKNISTLWGF